jgi:RimJ/RimL family protein N-acetyltransferase
MPELTLRELAPTDKPAFIDAMNASVTHHSPWVKAPQTSDEFDAYYQRSLQINAKSFIALDDIGDIVGVFNLNEIVLGAFQSAYLGYYGVTGHEGKGLMSAGLKLVLAKALNELGLHRIEANIQPENLASIRLVMANGFRKEGYSPRYLKIDGQWRDHERWAITVEDLQAEGKE